MSGRTEFAHLLTRVTTLLARDVGRRCEARRTLVFAPHPDDEVLGCGGTIARKVRAGAEVQIVFMTDGSGSHAELIDPQELAEIRRIEANDANRILGVSAEHVVFLGFRDGALENHLTQATQQVADILAAYSPDDVFVPHRADRLSDHVATFEIVAAALTRQPRQITLYEYPIWLWNTWPWTAGGPVRGASFVATIAGRLLDVLRLVGGCRSKVDISAVREYKLAALDAYRSQMQRRAGAASWSILGDVSNGDFLRCFGGAIEVFRRSQRPAAT